MSSIAAITFDRIVLREIQLPLREPFRISSGETSVRRILLLELTDKQGAGTWSECVAGELPNYSPETIDTSWLAIEQWLGPRVLGESFESPQAVDVALRDDVRGHQMASAAIEMAAWALSAQLEGQSLAQRIGGTRERIKTGISIGIQSTPEALVERAAAALAEGYNKIKIKIKPGADLEFLAAARSSLGEEAPIMADANNAYSLDDLDHLSKLDDFKLVMIEQPLAWDDVYRHAELQKRLTTPVCLDESITTLERARQMIELDAGRIVNIKPGRVGGFTESLKIHDLCQDNNIPVWCGGMLESGVGRSYNVALASLPNFKIPGDVSPSGRYWKQDVVVPEWEMDAQGTVGVPSSAGLGVEVDRDRIESLTVRSAELRG